MIPSLATANGLIPILFKYDNNFAGVRKTFDGTTDMTTSHLTWLSRNNSQVIGYSHSTRQANNTRQVAGYGRAPVRKTFGQAPVGAGHAREPLDRGQHPQEVRRGCKGLKPQQHTQGPLLQIILFLMQIGIIRQCISYL
jgi:hypothetical protein